MSTGKLEQQIWSYSVHTVFHKSSFRLKTWHFFMVLRGRAKMHVILKCVCELEQKRVNLENTRNSSDAFKALLLADVLR